MTLTFAAEKFIYIMKIKNLFFLLSLIICCSFSSCSKDDDGGYSKKENQENVVKLKISTNTPGIPIKLNCYFGQPLIIKDNWEKKYITKQYGAQLTATCDDNAVLITAEIYVNGKLRKRSEGNNYIMLGVDIK
jgi:hypothetical protein